MRHGAVLFLLAAVVLCGCGMPVSRPFEAIECSGMTTIEEAATLLSLQKQNVQPFTALAECTISWRQENGMTKDENVRGKLAFVPPDKIYFKADKFGEVRFGTNESEFWFRSKAGGMDTYWWGDKAQAAQCAETMILNPANIAEAVGVVDVSADWKLRHRGNYDILDREENGKRRKRIYINACDYRVEQIEYFSTDELTQIAIKLTDYTDGGNGISVPSVIRTEYFDHRGLKESSVEMELKHIRLLPPEKQGEKLFVRPSRDGYKEVLRLNEGCEFEIE